MAEKIMVVDDDATLANLLVNLLEMNNYKAEKVASGKQALRKALRDDPDLILIDINMPELNGFDVLAGLRSNTITARIPVVVMSILSDDLNVLDGWIQDSDGYISKPFDPRDLLETIRIVLRKALEERFEEKAQHMQALLDMIERLEDQYLETAV
ncbi:MAG: hypothetical protein A2W01_11405 [Candidatus Solincola sediminis]|uniref:Response regulatory domain-containing protein n=1 Tax=Candidatus Solincola sediminis TaxID=1797199 RepID=A0A1F2WKX7_9ACTN|nr:MAG: hypothetical protein A2Y75_00955 [Candidatus Solincola sediminis]OFW59446.1 MAG: hypothetical protein A2W01_11405 [Candidatus Solincola sediminis]